MTLLDFITQQLESGSLIAAPITDFVVFANKCSKTQARTLVSQGAVDINGVKASKNLVVVGGDQVRIGKGRFYDV